MYAFHTRTHCIYIYIYIYIYITHTRVFIYAVFVHMSEIISMRRHHQMSSLSFTSWLIVKIILLAFGLFRLLKSLCILREKNMSRNKFFTLEIQFISDLFLSFSGLTIVWSTWDLVTYFSFFVYFKKIKLGHFRF